MDKKISRPAWQQQLRKLALPVAAVVGSLALYSISQASPSGQSQHVNKAGLEISTVRQGLFQLTLPVRGQVVPKTTIYLDSIAGGQIEQRLAEQGDYVEKGQPLLKLSNTSLQLEVMSREAQVTEQLNFLRNTQMTMETNRLNLRRDLLDTELQINHLKRKLQQTELLLAKKLVPSDTVAQLKQDLQYFIDRRQLTLEQQAQENSIREQQLSQLKDSATMLQTNLQLARSNLDNLLVRAPVSGYLSELNAEVGESKERGARLGQIDLPDEFKLVIQLDEFYLNQVSRDMKVRVQLDQQPIEARISKIDSRVNQAQFQVEVALPTDAKGIRRGQSLDAELMLSSEQRQTLLLKRGAFISSSGGNWVYVLDPSSQQAVRREIRLGQRNQDVVEILDGLVVGDQVITSAYANFDKATNLNLK
jgi:HlyD family secretion protein